MQRVALSPLPIVDLCMCVYVCVSVCVYASLWITQKRFEINPPFFHQLVGHKKPYNDVFGDIVARDLDLLFEGQRFESRSIWKIKRDYLANGDSKHVLSRLLFFKWYIYI